MIRSAQVLMHLNNYCSVLCGIVPTAVSGKGTVPAAFMLLACE